MGIRNWLQKRFGRLGKAFTQKTKRARSFVKKAYNGAKDTANEYWDEAEKIGHNVADKVEDYALKPIDKASRTIERLPGVKYTPIAGVTSQVRNTTNSVRGVGKAVNKSQKALRRALGGALDPRKFKKDLMGVRSKAQLRKLLQQRVSAVRGSARGGVGEIRDASTNVGRQARRVVRR